MRIVILLTFVSIKGRVFAHEMAHLLFGVFDEFESGDGPKMFYIEDNSTKVTTVNKNRLISHASIGFQFL